MRQIGTLSTVCARLEHYSAGEASGRPLVFIVGHSEVTAARGWSPSNRARFSNLRFTSMSADPEDEFCADGMTEEIINALAQIEQLYVVARSSAFSFKGKYIDVRAVGNRLSVRTVLLGSVRRADQRLRITVQLVNAADGYHLWSDKYDREMKDIFDIQDEIARSIPKGMRSADYLGFYAEHFHTVE